MKKNKVIVYGIGNLAEYLGYVLKVDSPYEVCGYCIEESFLKAEFTEQFGLPIFNFNTIENTCSPDEYQLFIAVGNNAIRERLYNEAKSKGYSLINYVSSKATYWDNLILGDNVFIGEGSIIQPFTTIKNNVIFFAANVGHHSIIGNHALLSSCTLAGNVTVGDNSFIGLGATINQNVKIGYNNIIGVGCNITKNTEDQSVYSNSGTEKRAISAEKIGNKYLH